MIRRWTIRPYTPSAAPDRVYAPTGARFLTRYGAQRTAARLNAQLTERTPADPLYRPVALYSPGAWRRFRLARYRKRVATRLRRTT